MEGIGELIYKNSLLWIAMGFLNIIIARRLINKLEILINGSVREAMGGRGRGGSLYKRCGRLIRGAVQNYERREKKAGVYVSSRDKMRKSGYNGEMAAVVYLSIKYLLCPILFIAAFIINFPGLAEPLSAVLLVIAVTEAVLAAKRKSIGMRLQRHIYKIYKYLHNQISSGVKVQDAIRTVYEVIDDRYLKGMLIRLAARYELTLDIDASVAEFEDSFEVHEAQTLCIALKQGIITGDNQELLEKQEDVMFKKYFNYIQAETDGCKLRSAIVAVIFTAIVVLMIAIPLFKDVSEAVGKIFTN